MGVSVNCLTEKDEQIVFIQWCRINNIIVHHSPNEGGRGRAAMVRGAQMKKLGTSKGFWDLLVFVPQKDGTKLIIIEMKRVKGGSVSPEQKEWGEVYKSANIPCKICKGADEAIEFVKEFLV